MSRVLKICAGIAIGAVCLLVLLAMTLLLVSHDVSPAEDGDLVPEQVSVADERNAYLVLKQIEDKGLLTEELFDASARPDVVKDLAKIQQALGNNAEAFALVDRARGMAWLSPGLPDIAKAGSRQFLDSLESMHMFPRIGRAVLLRAEYRAATGEVPQAITDLTAWLQMLDSQRSSPQLYVAHLTNLALTRTTMMTLERILEKADAACILSQYREIGNAVEDAQAHLPEQRAEAYRMEYAFFRSVMRELPGAPQEPGYALAVSPLASYLFQPNVTLDLLADRYRAILRQGPLACTVAADWMTFEDPAGSLKSFLRPNLVGREALARLVPQSDPRHECAVKARGDMLALQVALHAYLLENGVLPETLGALLPRYREQLPTDPFTEAGYHYLPEKKMLYSIGMDIHDDGGDDKKDGVVHLP